jgi:uncharacterized membrane protein YdbT with pleckstrin-like domain
MSYIEESLSQDEEIKGLFNLHWFAWIPFFVWILLGFVSFGITWLVAIYVYLKLKRFEQGFTNKRVILKRGIVSRKTEEMKLKSIETVVIDQGVLGRIFNYGTVRITGRGISDVVFTNIANPLQVKRDIESVSNPLD